MQHANYKFKVIAVLILQIAIGSQIATAQNAPTPSEFAKYGGLLEAAHKGDTATILALIKAGADIETRDQSGRTALIVAAFASHDESVRALAEAGADLNALEFRAYDIVTIAAVANDLQLLDLVLDLGASSGNITSPYDGTALIAAAHLGHHEVVASLIENNAPLDHVNNLEWTALIEAVILGDGGINHTETVRLLLDAGADRTIGDSQGVTPLEHAKSRGFKDIVRLFGKPD